MKKNSYNEIENLNNCNNIIKNNSVKDLSDNLENSRNNTKCKKDFKTIILFIKDYRAISRAERTNIYFNMMYRDNINKILDKYNNYIYALSIENKEEHLSNTTKLIKMLNNKDEKINTLPEIDDLECNYKTKDTNMVDFDIIESSNLNIKVEDICFYYNYYRILFLLDLSQSMISYDYDERTFLHEKLEIYFKKVTENIINIKKLINNQENKKELIYSPKIIASFVIYINDEECKVLLHEIYLNHNNYIEYIEIISRKIKREIIDVYSNIYNSKKNIKEKNLNNNNQCNINLSKNNSNINSNLGVSFNLSNTNNINITSNNSYGNNSYLKNEFYYNNCNDLTKLLEKCIYILDLLPRYASPILILFTDGSFYCSDIGNYNNVLMKFNRIDITIQVILLSKLSANNIYSFGNIPNYSIVKYLCDFTGGNCLFEEDLKYLLCNKYIENQIHIKDSITLDKELVNIESNKNIMNIKVDNASNLDNLNKSNNNKVFNNSNSYTPNSISNNLTFNYPIDKISYPFNIIDKLKIRNINNNGRNIVNYGYSNDSYDNCYTNLKNCLLNNSNIINKNIINTYNKNIFNDLNANNSINNNLTDIYNNNYQEKLISNFKFRTFNNLKHLKDQNNSNINNKFVNNVISCKNCSNKIDIFICKKPTKLIKEDYLVEIDKDIFQYKKNVQELGFNFRALSNLKLSNSFQIIQKEVFEKYNIIIPIKRLIETRTRESFRLKKNDFFNELTNYTNKINEEFINNLSNDNENLVVSNKIDNCSIIKNYKNKCINNEFKSKKDNYESNYFCNNNNNKESIFNNKKYLCLEIEIVKDIVIMYEIRSSNSLLLDNEEKNIKIKLKGSFEKINYLKACQYKSKEFHPVINKIINFIKEISTSDMIISSFSKLLNDNESKYNLTNLGENEFINQNQQTIENIASLSIHSWYRFFNIESVEVLVKYDIDYYEKFYIYNIKNTLENNLNKNNSLETSTNICLNISNNTEYIIDSILKNMTNSSFKTQNDSNDNTANNNKLTLSILNKTYIKIISKEFNKDDNSKGLNSICIIRVIKTYENLFVIYMGFYQCLLSKRRKIVNELVTTLRDADFSKYNVNEEILNQNFNRKTSLNDESKIDNSVKKTENETNFNLNKYKKCLNVKDYKFLCSDKHLVMLVPNNSLKYADSIFTYIPTTKLTDNFLQRRIFKYSFSNKVSNINNNMNLSSQISNTNINKVNGNKTTLQSDKNNTIIDNTSKGISDNYKGSKIYEINNMYVKSNINYICQIKETLINIIKQRLKEGFIIINYNPLESVFILVKLISLARYKIDDLLKLESTSIYIENSSKNKTSNNLFNTSIKDENVNEKETAIIYKISFSSDNINIELLVEPGSGHEYKSQDNELKVYEEKNFFNTLIKYFRDIDKLVFDYVRNCNFLVKEVFNYKKKKMLDKNIYDFDCKSIDVVNESINSKSIIQYSDNTRNSEEIKIMNNLKISNIIANRADLCCLELFDPFKSYKSNSNNLNNLMLKHYNKLTNYINTNINFEDKFRYNFEEIISKSFVYKKVNYSILDKHNFIISSNNKYEYNINEQSYINRFYFLFKNLLEIVTDYCFLDSNNCSHFCKLINESCVIIIYFPNIDRLSNCCMNQINISNSSLQNNVVIHLKYYLIDINNFNINCDLINNVFVDYHKNNLNNTKDAKAFKNTINKNINLYINEEVNCNNLNFVFDKISVLIAEKLISFIDKFYSLVYSKNNIIGLPDQNKIDLNLLSNKITYIYEIDIKDLKYISNINSNLFFGLDYYINNLYSILLYYNKHIKNSVVHFYNNTAAYNSIDCPLSSKDKVNEEDTKNDDIILIEILIDEIHISITDKESDKNIFKKIITELLNNNSKREDLLSIKFIFNFVPSIEDIYSEQPYLQNNNLQIKEINLGNTTLFYEINFIDSDNHHKNNSSIINFNTNKAPLYIYIKDKDYYVKIPTFHNTYINNLRKKINSVLVCNKIECIRILANNNLSENNKRNDNNLNTKNMFGTSSIASNNSNALMSNELNINFMSKDLLNYKLLNHNIVYNIIKSEEIKNSKCIKTYYFNFETVDKKEVITLLEKNSIDFIYNFNYFLNRIYYINWDLNDNDIKSFKLFFKKYLDKEHLSSNLLNLNSNNNENNNNNKEYNYFENKINTNNKNYIPFFLFISIIDNNDKQGKNANNKDNTYTDSVKDSYNNNNNLDTKVNLVENIIYIKTEIMYITEISQALEDKLKTFLETIFIKINKHILLMQLYLTNTIDKRLLPIGSEELDHMYNNLNMRNPIKSGSKLIVYNTKINENNMLSNKDNFNSSNNIANYKIQNKSFSSSKNSISNLNYSRKHTNNTICNKKSNLHAYSLDLTYENTYFLDFLYAEETFKQLIIDANRNFEIKNSKEYYSTFNIHTTDICIFKIILEEKDSKKKSLVESSIRQNRNLNRFSSSFIEQSDEDYNNVSNSINIKHKFGTNYVILIKFFGIKPPSQHVIDNMRQFINEKINFIKIKKSWESIKNIGSNYLNKLNKNLLSLHDRYWKKGYIPTLEDNNLLIEHNKLIVEEVYCLFEQGKNLWKKLNKEKFLDKFDINDLQLIMISSYRALLNISDQYSYMFDMLCQVDINFLLYMQQFLQNSKKYYFIKVYCSNLINNNNNITNNSNKIGRKALDNKTLNNNNVNENTELCTKKNLIDLDIINKLNEHTILVISPIIEGYIIIINVKYNLKFNNKYSLTFEILKDKDSMDKAIFNLEDEIQNNIEVCCFIQNLVEDLTFLSYLMYIKTN